MISLWMIYFLMIIMGQLFRIDSPLYSSIYAAFLGLVLVVTFGRVLVHSARTAQDIRFLWGVFFAVVLMDLFGVVIDEYSNSPFFALYMAALLLCVFVKTLFSRGRALGKAIACASAFMALMAAELVFLLYDIAQANGYDLENLGINEFSLLAADLPQAIRMNGGAAFFISPVRLFGNVSGLFDTISQVGLTYWQAAAFVASAAAADAVAIALPIAALGFLAKWRLDFRRFEQHRLQQDEEQAQAERERLDAEREEREREQAERFELAKNLVRSATNGDTQAQYDLGMLYIGDENYEQAIHWLRQAAANDDAQSNYVLGKLCIEGADGLEPDLEEALNLLEVAANLDHVEAQFRLGCLYFDGAGSDTPNYSKAAQWWGRAASNDHLEAMSRLAKLHTMGDEFPAADAHLAIKLMKKLAFEHSGQKPQESPLGVLIYNKPLAEPQARSARDRRQTGIDAQRARVDELKAELYWLNEGIKQKQKFLEDFAEEWDWRNDETQKRLREDVARAREVADELESLTGREIDIAL